jgi:YHS domain-containing protein
VLRFILLGILLFVVARAFWRLMGGMMETARGPRPASRRRGDAVKLVRDPVCGIFIPQGSTPSLTSSGATYYFCSEECRAKFQHP